MEYGLVINRGYARAEIVFRAGGRDVFERLMRRRAALDETFDGELVWDGGRNPQGQCRVYLPVAGGLDDEAEWPRIHADMVGQLARLQRGAESAVREALLQTVGE